MATVAYVWQKRFYDNTVLISTTCVNPGKQYVVFSADRNMQNLYSYNGNEVLSNCSTQPNGKGRAYIVPLSYLVDEGPLPERFILERDKSYEEYKKYQEKQKNRKSKNNLKN